MKNKNLHILLALIFITIIIGINFLIYIKVNQLGITDNIILQYLFISVFFSIALLLLFFSAAFAKPMHKNVSQNKSEKQENEQKQQAKQNHQYEEELKKEEIIPKLTNNLLEINEEKSQFVDTTNKLHLFAENFLKKISREFDFVQGLFFIQKEDKKTYTLLAQWAFYSNQPINDFEVGEGISGQAVKDKKILNIVNVPKDYISIIKSGLGETSPKNLFILPIINKEDVLGLVELASFNKITKQQQELFTDLSTLIGQQLSELIETEQQPA